MIGKKNIVFGFFYLVFTAALGPVMVDMYKDYGIASGEKQTAVSRIQLLKENDFEEDLEALNGEQIAKANVDTILSLNKLMHIESSIDRIKGGAHAHGNLESLLNIVTGIVICFLAVSVWLKQLISWLFIIGTIMHSGMLYLSTVFELTWANTLLETGIGPICILAGLLVTGIATAIGFKEQAT